MTANILLTENFRIVSGGQTGADTAGLDWAIEHNIPHGGWCPKGCKSETGKIDEKYQLKETPSAGYAQRTEWNVRDSDATLIFTITSKLDGGSKKIAEFCEKHGKPFLHFRKGVHAKYIVPFLNKNNVKTLNIAGRRESSAPGIYEFTLQTLNEMLELASSEQYCTARSS